MRPPEIRLLQKFHFSVSAHSHRCLFSHFLPLHLTLHLLLSCSHVCASCPVLISTHLYIAGLSPHSCCMCYWKSEEWVLHFEYTALSGQEEKTRQGERKREAGNEESAIDRQANTSQPLSPSLSIVFKC